MPASRRPRPRPGPRSGVTVRAAVTVAPVGFLLAIQEDRHISRSILFPVLVVATILAVAGARRLPSSRPLALVGGFVAVLMAWLVAQRDDAGTAIILAVLFAIGATLAVWEPPPPLSRATRNTAIGVVIGLFVLRLFVPENVLLAVSASAVLVAALLTASEWFPLREPYRAHGFAFGTILVVVALVFAGYLGAETPDATWFGGGTVHGRTDTGEVALTFDDGPNLGASEKVMAILDANGIKGTFFEVGKAVDAEPRITRALYDDGQLIGNHSYEHDQWRWLDPRYPELQRAQNAFRRAIGTCPVLYRPPHGDRTPFLAHVVEQHHMHMVLWSASAGDWATDDAQLVAHRILANARPGAILLLHDGLDGNPSADRQVLVRALPLIIDGLRAKGLKPVRLDELLGTAAYQAC
jgi:peptidoglycan/xylan/chitin deacetylase (PgdA/CDA1 family)